MAILLPRVVRDMPEAAPAGSASRLRPSRSAPRAKGGGRRAEGEGRRAEEGRGRAGRFTASPAQSGSTTRLRRRCRASGTGPRALSMDSKPSRRPRSGKLRAGFSVCECLSRPSPRPTLQRLRSPESLRFAPDYYVFFDRLCAMRVLVTTR